jgi:hypothetical protein
MIRIEQKETRNKQKKINVMNVKRRKSKRSKVEVTRNEDLIHTNWKQTWQRMRSSQIYENTFEVVS